MPLPDDIKSSVLTEVTRGPLTDHLVLNTTKLRDDDGVRDNIQCFLEKRQNSEPVTMDVDVFVKGNHSKRSVCKRLQKSRLTCAITAVREAMGQETAMDKEEEQTKVPNVMMARGQVEEKVLLIISMASQAQRHHQRNVDEATARKASK